MRLANEVGEIHRRGGEVVAVCVDPPERNAAHAQRWHLPFPLVSDPGGERYLKPLDAWNPDERGGIGIPTIIIVSPHGEVVHRYRSRDFADRPDDDDVFAALEGLGLEPVDPPEWEPEAEPEEDPGAFRTEALGHYFRGVASATLALSLRTDGAAREEALQVRQMAVSFAQAWRERREAAGG